MTENEKLRALLAEAREVVAGVLRAADSTPYAQWSRDQHQAEVVRERIDAALASGPVEDIPLREENFALRAALAVRYNDENWRLKYLASELKRLRAEKDCAEWQTTAQTVVDLFDPLKPAASPAVLHAVAQGVKVANKSLRADREWDAATRDALMESQERLALEVKAHIEKLNNLSAQLDKATKAK